MNEAIAPVGFGTVGFGMIARTHLVAMQANLALHPNEPRGRPRALCTRRPEACAGLPYEVIYTDPDKLVTDEAVRVVDICTSNHLHVSVAEAAVNAGKAVYIEKPISNSLEEARRLCELAEKKDVPNQVALVMRFRPDVNRAKDLLAVNAIGEPIHYRACFYHGSYLDPARPISWRQTLALSGGGSIMDLGIHLLDLVRYVLGQDVAKLDARLRTVNKRRYINAGCMETVVNDTDEYASLTLVMENGAVGTVESSRVSDSTLANEYFEVFGTGGSLLLTLSGTGGIALKRNDALTTPGSPPGPYESALGPFLPGSRQSMGPFMDAHAAALQNISCLAVGRPGFMGTPTLRDGVKAQQLVTRSLDTALWS